MAITQQLAVGTSSAQSSDVVIAAGSQLVACLNDAAGPTVAEGALIYVEFKDAAGQYFYVGSLTPNKPMLVLAGPATYRFNRPAGVSCGACTG